MWNWIKENSDWLCSITFGRLPPGIRLIFGILYELFDYVLRVVALLVPGSGLALNGPYLFVAVLLAGSEGIKWGLGDALIGFIPFGDWFPGLSVACFRVWREYAPDPGQQVFQRRERGGRRMGCLSYSFRIFLTVLLTAASLYFGGMWAWSHFYDYRDLAWEEVKGSPAGLLATGQDKVAEKFGGAAEVVKPWLEKGKGEAGKKIDELSRTLGIGRRSSGETKKESEARKRMAEGKEEEEEISPPTEETEEKGVEKTEDKEKAKLLERAKKLELGPRASELYAGKTTTKKAEELREQDLAYFGKWFLRIGIANLVLFLSLFFLPKETGATHRLDDYISMDDDEL